jgi:hypothetical protein
VWGLDRVSKNLRSTPRGFPRAIAQGAGSAADLGFNESGAADAWRVVWEVDFQ